MTAQRKAAQLVTSLVVLLASVRLEAGDETSPVLVVALDNRAAVRPATMQRACATVTRVYAAAGVDLRWNGCPGTDTSESPRITLAVIPSAFAHARTGSRNVLGLAAETDAGIGRMAYLFYDRIVAFAEHRGHDVSATLALTMTHELGHLLLPPISHGAGGVMKARWAFADMVDVSQGRLRFPPEQAAIMRERLRAW